MEVCLTGSDQVKLHPWGWGDGVDENPGFRKHPVFKSLTASHKVKGVHITCRYFYYTSLKD